MPKKQVEPDTPDPIDFAETPPDLADAPPDIHHDQAPAVPPQYDSAMEAPDHPLHYHCKEDSPVSPSTPQPKD